MYYTILWCMCGVADHYSIVLHCAESAIAARSNNSRQVSTASTVPTNLIPGEVSASGSNKKALVLHRYFAYCFFLH